MHDGGGIGIGSRDSRRDIAHSCLEVVVVAVVSDEAASSTTTPMRFDWLRRPRMNSVCCWPPCWTRPHLPTGSTCLGGHACLCVSPVKAKIKKAARAKKQKNFFLEGLFEVFLKYKWK